MLYVKKEIVHNFTKSVFLKMDLSEDDANQAAEVVVQSEYSGVQSHGLARLQMYVNRLQQGMVNKNPNITQRNSSEYLIALDGDNGSGLVVGPKAVNICIEKAKKYGIAAVAINNSNHYGVGNYYGWKFAEAGLIGIMMTSTTPVAAPFGGKEVIIGSNPLTVAIPAGERYPVVLDMATSATAYGQIQAAFNKGAKIPLDWALDKDGNPTDDPAAALIGSIKPMSGHKGYGLAFIIDIFSAVLSQAAYGKDIGSLSDPGNPRIEKIGHFMMAIDPSKFLPMEAFRKGVDGYIDTIKNSEKLDGVKEIFAPGEIEFLNAKDREEKGIPIQEEMEIPLLNLARELNLASNEDTIESLFKKFK